MRGSATLPCSGMRRHVFIVSSFIASCSVLCCLIAGSVGCGGAQQPTDPFNVLTDRLPQTHRLGDIPIAESDYVRLWRWGEIWFRSATFGNERTMTDLIGLLNGTVQVPCARPSPPDCQVNQPVLPFYASAIDALDGVPGNLFTGNGGPDGTGFTNDLVLTFPPGTKLHGFEVPERLHTGLDVEAGSAWPIGIVPVPVGEHEPDQPYFVHPEALGVGPAKAERLRLGMSCAVCHYSLDVDWDGVPDLHSAQPEHPTPGSPYRPAHAWPIGNQDLHLGWLFALSANPLLTFSVFSAPLAHDTAGAALAWVDWLRDNYARAPEATVREVVRGMLVQPRGFADVSPNALHDAEQLPTLLTRGNWPSNYDGVLVNPADRNSSIWTAALELSIVVGLAADRAAKQQAVLYWEPVSPFRDLPAAQLADMMVSFSPAVRADPRQRQPLIADILGTADGVPGMLRTDAVVVMEGPGGTIPPEILNHQQNVLHKRVREPEDYGGDAVARGPLMALGGVRIRTPPEMLAEVDATALAARYPGLNLDELASDAVSLMLDANQSPPNLSPLLARAAPLIERGYAIFRASGCAGCHRGSLLADNLIHPNSLQRAQAQGLPNAPSTAGWRRTERVAKFGPAIGSAPTRAESTRTVRLYVAPSYDPRTGKALSAGSPAIGLLGERVVGYKTMQLRYLWGSAPYLHDGGVGVCLQPTAAPAGDDLQALLRRPARDKWYGMGRVLAQRERDPERVLRADAALSLQALLLQSERARVIEANAQLVFPAPRGVAGPTAFDEPIPEKLSMNQLGVYGTGHEFWVDDEPGGNTITPLIAFLLALDDDPGDVLQAPQH